MSQIAGVETRKPWLPFAEQEQLLKNRGLMDTEQLLSDLRYYNYYRLSGYWYIFRKKYNPNETTDDFRPGTSYKLIHELVEFDQKLRYAVFALTTDLEIGLRTAIASTMAKRNELCHEKPDHLGVNTPRQYEGHGMFLKKIGERIKSSNEVFIKHYIKEYNYCIPTWVLVEILQFGELVRLLSFAKQQDKKTIAESFGIQDHKFFHSTILSLNTLRNICAHHGRLWNRVLGNMPKSKKNIIPDLAHLPLSNGGKNSCPPDRLFFILSILIFMLDKIGRTERIKDLISLIDKLPKSNEISIQSMGFPQQWKALHPWDKFA